jgi:hypothetical protein
MEQLIVFLLGLWLFGLFVNAPLGAVIGLGFVIGRMLSR